MTKDVDWDEIEKSLGALMERDVRKEHPLHVAQPSSSRGRMQSPQDIYVSAYEIFLEKRKNLYEWQELERTRKKWHHLYDVDAKTQYEQALLLYHQACSDLPEWMAYYEAMKNLKSS